MIELTVKTLDSQNHAFTVDDDITVAQFKEKIAETVNIPADTQRIIYCGRVLQDSSKLNEYDVNGKVVHLVQRPPPSPNQRNNQRSESPPPQPHRRIRGLEYLGSMRFPANAFEQNMPPLPTHSLAASRLNVARRMLRRADTVLNALENPTARPPDQQTQEEPQEEVTPVFEARVIVPSVPNEPIDEAAVVLSAVQNSILNAVPMHDAQVSAEATATAETSDALPQSTADIEGPHSVSSTPEVISPLATSSENLAVAGEEQGGSGTSEENNESANNANGTPANASTSGNSTTENVSRTAEYAALLDTLNWFHARLAPFLEQYNDFMRQDPTVEPENARATQAMINRVSEILHFLGHAYHSLSDIIVRVRTPPPRPLLCRPILIQHSAIVQAGIPIQVEAQINFSADRNTSSTNGTATTQSSTTTASQQTTTTTTASNSGPTITAHMQPTMVGFPLIPGTGVRVETFHLPASANLNLDRAGLNRNNNNNRGGPYVSVRSTADIIAAAAASAAAAAVSAAATNAGVGNVDVNASGPNGSTTSEGNDGSASAVASSGSTTAPNTASGVGQAVTGNSGNNSQASMNNPNVEFFMEVTPESITIDSLETSFVGTNQANDILQGTLNPPPPELIQSIMQMAGQLINRGTQNVTGNIASTVVSTTPTPSAPPSETAVTDSQGTTTSNGGAARTIPFQNSQARGNTQTQPTTSTHTRSTARPHVHLAQHAMQGFDPFLPCNSHHVTPRRRIPPASGASQQNGNQQNQINSTATRTMVDGTSEPRPLDQNNPFYNIVRSIVNSVRNAYTYHQSGAQPNAQSTTSSTPSTASNSNPLNIPADAPAWMSTLQNMNLSDSGFQRAPTIAQLLQQLPDDTYTEGESIFTDLIMLLSRNLTIGDVVQVNAGRLEPLMRIRTQLRNFFLYRILDGSQSTGAVERGVERLLTEAQPFLDHLALLDTRDDIDIVRSVQTLLRARLPNIISLVASRSPNSLKMVVDQIRTTGRQFCALAVRASQNGRQGVENVFDLIMTRYMQGGMPRDLQQWTLMTGRAQISTFLSHLDVPESILQPYIVREVDAITPSVIEEQVRSSVSTNVSEPEPMQVEETGVGVGPGGSTTSDVPLPPINLAEDPEPLPTVVLGADSWHGQVPSDWVPIIARDSQRQRRQNSQPPFSDAYLSGMPSKRRKIVASSKPQGSLPQVITESVRRAVTATGLTGVAPVEAVAQAAGTDINIQSAYRDLLRSSVQSGLRDNEDFTPERFPNASNYFSKHPQ